MLYFGIDNGVSGSLAAISSDGGFVKFAEQFTFSQQDYTKTKKNITRVNMVALNQWLLNMLLGQVKPGDQAADVLTSGRAFIERPMVNPTRFTATGSALRALEATLLALERVPVPYQFVDSREWQKVLLPAGVSGPALKDASRDIGIRLFPQFKHEITKHGDADGLLIAEWARRNQR